jgi:peptide-methionine (R)-S-oxide reductase
MDRPILGILVGVIFTSVLLNLLRANPDEASKTGTTGKSAAPSAEPAGEDQRKSPKVKVPKDQPTAAATGEHQQRIQSQVKNDPPSPNPHGKLRTGSFNKLEQFESWVLVHKGTERAFTGDYWNHKATGTYVCRRCNAALYRSADKFDSGCGWPSFDDELPKAVTRVADKDGQRIEIVCTNCGGHLGHVFLGERLTKKDTRHCVNSVSIKFVPADKPLPEPIKSKTDRSKSGESNPDSKIHQESAETAQSSDQSNGSTAPPSGEGKDQ